MSSHKLGKLLLATTLGIGATIATVPASQASVYGCPTSTVCVHSDIRFTGAEQRISGYSWYTDLYSSLHDRASSWINANRYSTEAIGEWRGGHKYIAQVLPAGWYEDNLGKNAGFDNKADFIQRI